MALKSKEISEKLFVSYNGFSLHHVRGSWASTAQLHFVEQFVQ